MPQNGREPGYFLGPASPKYARSEELGARITEYAAWLNAGEYRLLELIHEFDREELWHLDGIHSCAHWLNWKCGVGMNAAREKVRVANALAELPGVSETYRRGEISYSKVRAITRIATPETEEYLLMIARHGTAAHVEGLVSRYRRCKRLQDEKNAVRQHTLRELSLFYDDDGMCTLRGKLPAESGALVLKALKLAMDRAEAEAREERKRLKAMEKSRQDVSAETATKEELIALRRDPAGDVRPNESFAARRADALTRLAETYLSNGPQSRSSADRYQVVVHVSAETLKANPPDDGVSAETVDPFQTDFSYLEDGPHVSAETARRIGCDAAKIDVIDDIDGEPLNIGRKSRLIPPALARALRMRDDGCRFPGCTHKHFVDGHHIKHWADGGETSLSNLVQLCRYHHRLVHEHGFGCERTAGGRILFTNAQGREIGRTSRLPALTGRVEPRDWLSDQLGNPGIDSKTGVTLWRGEKMDWHLAVGHLFD